MDVLDKYFRSNKYFMSRHHLDSFDDFVTNKLQNTIRVLNPITVLKNQENGIIAHEIDVYVGGKDSSAIFLRQPLVTTNNTTKPLLPNNARLHDMTYACDLFADVIVVYTTHNKTTQKNEIEEITLKDVKLGSIPIMLHSKLCYLHNKTPEVLRSLGECIKDVGGYFIVDGKEKVIVAQERIATNRIFINKSNDDKFSHSGMIRCTSVENPLFPKTINIYAVQPNIGKHSKLTPNSLLIQLPGFPNHYIPLFVLFRALGVESDKSILSHIIPDVDSPVNKKLLDFLYYSIISSKTVMTQEDALQFLANRIDVIEYKTIEKVHSILSNDVFPNMGTNYFEKALFLGSVVNKLIRVVIGADKESDRDNYLYKRVDISGFLIGNLFRDYYNQFRNKMRNQIDQQYLYGPWKTSLNISSLINKSNFYKIFDSNVITNGLMKSLKGSWGRNMMYEKVNLDNIKQGIVQDLSRISYMSYTSHIRRVNTPIDPTAKVVAPHRLHPTQWGVMCPCESPDGGSIGLLKNFAIMCHVTFDAPIDPIVDILLNNGMQPISLHNTHKCKILVNSNWKGVHDSPDVLHKHLKDLKRKAKIDIYTSISWNIFENEINILTEAGRCTRPLFTVQDGTLLYDPEKHKQLSWKELITHGLIEYMDVEEIGYAYVAMMPKDITKYHTHCELHPSTIFSVVTHNIPLANHNQAPRNVFYGAQGKQAIGAYATNFNSRIDTMSYLLHYPQRPLVGTKYMDYIGNNELPAGANLIVAIATYTGYNQEDSIIINKSAIERGLFNVTYFKSIIDDEDENQLENEKLIFANPLKMTQNGIDLKNVKYAKYDKLDENGLPILNSYITEGDAIVGKTVVKKEMADSDATEKIKETYRDQSMIADKTVAGVIDKVIVYPFQGQRRCKIRMRKFRIPELGDKMASRSGQKGVVGHILDQADMPFNETSGITPDIIINPHAFPSRMTIAHLLECVLSKVGVQMGCTVDGTPFNDYDYDEFLELLKTKFGLEKHGNETLYNGFNGRKIETEIFFGPTYYMRLKHMVGDKMNYRGGGGAVAIKTRQPTKGRSAGGALRLGEMEFHCNYSHGMMHFMKESLVDRSDKYTSFIDNNTGDFLKSAEVADNISKIKTPYCFKLLTQEVAALGIKTQIITNGQYVETIPEEEYEDDLEYNVVESSDDDEK